MGRSGAVLVFLAGACSFSGEGGGSGDGPGRIDARRIDGPRIDGDPDVIDAPVDAMVDADACQAPFARTEHGCHALGAATPRTWSAARSACQSIGGDLPIVDTVAESVHIATAIPAGDLNGRAWIGLTGTTSNGSTWTWIDGRTVAQHGLDNWNTGEPGSSDACAVVRPGGSWAGRSCNDVFIVVCER